MEEHRVKKKKNHVIELDVQNVLARRKGERTHTRD